MRAPVARVMAVLAILVSACSDQGTGSDRSTAAATEPSSVDRVAAGLPADATWQWQLTGEIDTDYDVDVYDIDLFEAPREVIDDLHDEGRTVVCYFSAGSLEDWRTDVDALEPAAVGAAMEGWDGEWWVDVRDPTVRGLMADRLDLAVERGCDGVEPDNVEGYANATGFELTADDQLDFNRFLAREAHERGLLIGLKNDLEQIPALVGDFDFAVNEQCFEFDECDALEPFVDAGKPVFTAEYREDLVADHEDLCTDARRRGLHTLILPVDLDDEFRISCDG